MCRKFWNKVSIFLVSAIVASMSTPFMTTARATTLTPTAQVSFTFDDGFTSARTLAADAMATHGVSGTNYIITDCVGMVAVLNTCAANTQSTYMTWSQIAELANNYGWEIGSHTQTHPLLASTDPVEQPEKLTLTQVTSELLNSRNALTAQGFSATSFASPYGDFENDGHPVIETIAKYYASHRGFADTGYNTFPYNDYLLVDQQIQSTTTVSRIKGYIDTALANKQWLILTFHEIVPSGAGSTSDRYDFNVSDLGEIAEYAKNSGIRIVNPGEALVQNTGNLLPDSSFDLDVETYSGSNIIWSTDDSSLVAKNTDSNGSYPNFQNSVQMTSNPTKNAHLYSPKVIIDSSKKYIIKNFVNITTAVGEVAFYIDEYDQNNNYIGTTAQYLGSMLANDNPRARNYNIEYIPSATTTSARLQIVLVAGSGSLVYLDNIQWFANDGSTTGSGVVSPPVTAKQGDVNGDNYINAIDLSIISTNWNKTGVLKTQGDLNIDGVVNAIDLSILSTNWGK